ncbi:MAG: universal stress protein [Gemmatimonadota bacterium]
MKLDRILMGATFDPPTVDAVRWVQTVLGPEAELILVHCQEKADADGPPPEERLDALVADAAPGARALTFTGDPEKVLPEQAAEHKADLLVLGPRGTSGSGPGNTAASILAGSRIPVLVVRESTEGPPRQILASVDDSPVAALVLRWTRFLTERFGAEAAALHAVSSAHYGTVSAVSSSRGTENAMAKGMEGARRWLEEQVAAAGIAAAAATVEVREGAPGETIVERSRDGRTDLVVMGSRGAGLLGRALLGSTAASVVAQAHCPVFVVPAAAVED